MLTSIPIKELSVKAYHLWEYEWLLLTAGDFQGGNFNTMTVAWGSLGDMWARPIAMVVVRPVRYTYQFMEKYDTFTLCTFPRRYRKALSLLGTKSGRDGAKIAASGLTPTPAQCVQAPVFAEANFILECRKIYWDDFKPDHFLDPALDANYPQKDYHRMYFGEILGAFTQQGDAG
jgi:flavin reductase (DIM6/NTAB) family NADH-FMN oxidoreductase RutF